MGFFDLFRNSNSEIPSVDLSAYPSIRGEGLFDIVGESFYGSSFKKLAAKLRIKRGQEAEVRLLLVADPNNRFSKSGKAVGVYSEGLQVGHIPENYAFYFFDRLQERGGRASVKARLWLDDITSDFSRSSVQIFTDIPPQFTDEETPLGYQTSTSYYLKYGDESRRKIDDAFEKRVSNGPGKLPELSEVKSVFLSFNNYEDRELIKRTLEANGILIDEIRAKGERARLMLIGDGELGESVHTSRALLYDIPILTVSELYDSYQALRPTAEVLQARDRYRVWRKSHVDDFGFVRLENDQIVDKAVEGCFFIPGNCYMGRPSFQIGIFEEDEFVSDEISSTRSEIWKARSLRPFDSCILVSRLGAKTAPDKFCVLFDGQPIAVTSPDNLDYFEHVGPREDILVQLNCTDANVFTASFELSKWKLEL